MRGSIVTAITLAFGVLAGLLGKNRRFREALAVAAKWVSVSPSAIAYGKRGINRVPTGDLAGGQSDCKASSTRPKT